MTRWILSQKVMSKLSEIIEWMTGLLEKDRCLYQDDVVDLLVKSGKEDFLRENSAGNLVLSREILKAFRSTNESSVVWVRPDKYWRFRVAEDEDRRDAKG